MARQKEGGYRELARLTVWDREQWTKAQAKDAARWLREKATEIEGTAPDREPYADRVRFRYFER